MEENVEYSVPDLSEPYWLITKGQKEGVSTDWNQVPHLEYQTVSNIGHPLPPPQLVQPQRCPETCAPAPSPEPPKAVVPGAAAAFLMAVLLILGAALGYIGRGADPRSYTQIQDQISVQALKANGEAAEANAKLQTAATERSVTILLEAMKACTAKGGYPQVANGNMSCQQPIK